jgi:RNA polymerase sigma-70 factor (ECF subfamily)
VAFFGGPHLQAATLAAAFGGGGLWLLLRTAVRGYITIRLERESRAATASVLGLLPAGGRLVEHRPGGHSWMVQLPTPATAPEVSLVAEETGDPDEAFTELIRTEWHKICGCLVNLGADPAQAEDITQDAFLATRFQWDRVGGFGRPVAYVYKVAIRLLRARRQREGLVAPHPDPTSLLQPQPCAEDVTEDIRSVGEAIGSLAGRQRECVLLHYIYGLSVTETAEVLGVREGTVKGYLAAARDTLRHLLTTPDDDEGAQA